MIRYNITFVYKNGLRGLLGANQGRYFHDTRESAEAHLKAVLENNSEEKLLSICGEQAKGTFRVDPFDCYEKGDAKGIYVRTVEEIVTIFAEEQQWNEKSIETLLIQFIEEKALNSELYLFLRAQADSENEVQPEG